MSHFQSIVRFLLYISSIDHINALSNQVESCTLTAIAVKPDTVLTMPTEKPTFSPVNPVPISNFFNAESRIRDLREMLLDKSLEFQKENILFAIYLYETGQLPPKRECDTTWILNGKVVDQLPDDLPKGSVVWGEVCLSYILCYYFTYLTLSVSTLYSFRRPLRHHR